MPDRAAARRERAERIRERYAESEPDRRARMRTRDLFLSVTLVGMGLLMVLGTAANRMWGGIPGGLCVAAAGVPVRWADRRVLGTLLALGLFLVGLVLAMQPWTW